MSFRFDDLPTLDNSGRVGRPASPEIIDAYTDISEPSVATQVAELGVALGMDALRTLQNRYLPSGMVAMSGSGPSYTTYSDCTIYPDTDGCDAPCYGFPVDQMSTIFCATCSEQDADPKNNPAWNWHFSGMRGNLQLLDREPDICNGRDAWKWKIESPCRGCNQEITFRCHDGWKIYQQGGPLTPTICEGIISCDNELTVCP